MITRLIDKKTMEVTDSKGRTFLISPQDEELVQRYTWYVSKVGYVERKDWAKGANITKRLHKAILPNAAMVDHINGDRTDNRRTNLRQCNKSTNAMNVSLPSNNKYGYKGITKRTEPNYKGKEVYRANIRVNGKVINLGTFYSLEDAGKARIIAEKKYFGEYRREYCNG